MTEPFASRWKRRAKTVPIMLGATVAAILGAPFVIPAAVLADAVRGRRKLPAVRVYLFVLQYLVNDTVEILVAGPYWLAAGFGRRLHSPTSIVRHERIQRWSIATLARRADRLLGLRIQLEPDADAALTPGPAIVVCRHVSLFDASLPSLLYQSRGFSVRGVLMAELLADPGFDLLYGRLGSVFIARDSGSEAREAVRRMGDDLGPATVAVIFPEGRLFRPELLAKGMAKLAHTDPIRAERLRGLRHTLIPRPGGLSALLDAAPGADVVVIAHAGLDAYSSFADVARNVPLNMPLRVAAWRIPRADIPGDPDDRLEWLDHLWCRLDTWVDQNITLRTSC